MARQVLVTTKEVLDAMDNAATNAIVGLKRIQLDSIESCKRFKQETKRVLVERTTSMATKIQTFAKETYGGFMSQDKIDNATQAPTERLIKGLKYPLERIDCIPDEEYDSRWVDQMQEQHIRSREDLLSFAMAQAIDMVGEDLALEVAEEVFGSDDANLAIGSVSRRRGVASGLFGMAKAAIKGGGKIGGSAI